VGWDLLDHPLPSLPKEDACEEGQKDRDSAHPKREAPACDANTDTTASTVVRRDECIEI